MYPLKKLSEICEIVNGGTPDTWNQSYWDGDILWITPKDMWKLKDIYVSETFRKITKEWLANSSAKLFPPNSIILSSRAPIWHLAINTEPMCTNQGCKWLIPRKNLDAKYLYYFLLNSVDLLNNLWTGTTFKELSSSKLKEVEVPLPLLSVQLDIVTHLDSAMAEIEMLRRETESALASTRELWESTLESVFVSGGEDCEEKRLWDTYDVRDGTHDSPKYQSTGYPLITSKNLRPEWLSFNNIKLISETDYQKINERSKVHKWNILFAMIGTIGSPTIVEIEPEFAIKNVALFKVPETQNNRFLKYYLSSRFVVQKMMSESKWSTQKFVWLGYLRDFKIPLPPLPEQSRIVAHLDAVRAEMEQLEWFYSEKLASLDELRRSVLAEAFLS